MSRAIGRSLELYYINGQPDGMLTAEMFNWTGHVLMTPRTRIAEALSRPEARFAGVYLLIGEQDGVPRAYVGEGEDISARIRSHDIAKDWWAQAVLITAFANRLNKAHIRYLESRLIEQARRLGRAKLDNLNTPACPAVSEADAAKMEAFLENLFIVLPAVRVDLFIENTRPTISTPNSPGPTTATEIVRFKMAVPMHSLTATAIWKDGEFIVEKNSLARAKWEGVSTQDSGYAQLHAELCRSGILVTDGDTCRFTENYAFRSPSAAAAVVAGRPTSGPAAWRESATGMSYREWEDGNLKNHPL